MPLYDEEKKPQGGGERDRSNRPSWRELDRRKDGSSSAGGEPGGQGPRPGTKAAYLQQRASSQAKSQAESLFSNPKEDQSTARVRAANDAAAVKTALDSHREAYGGLPDDPGALIQCLLYPDPAVQIEVLERLGEVLPELEGSTRETTVRGISLFRLSARDMTARKAAKRVLKRNGVKVASY